MSPFCLPGFLLYLIAMTEKCLSFFTISFKLYMHQGYISYIKVIYMLQTKWNFEPTGHKTDLV